MLKSTSYQMLSMETSIRYAQMCVRTTQNVVLKYHKIVTSIALISAKP
jgi:hypothetical protein